MGIPRAESLLRIEDMPWNSKDIRREAWDHDKMEVAYLIYLHTIFTPYLERARRTDED